jgi:hypothetical protein
MYVVSTLTNFKSSSNIDYEVKGHAVALVEALCYKLEGHGLYSRYHWIFQFTQFFQPHYGLGVDSASNRNEY